MVIGIVEDDTSMLKGINRLLDVHGYSTELYNSAESYIDQASASDAACLIVDIHLSGMSGIELHRHLTASGSTLPIIFITAVDNKQTEKAALEIGCIAYLYKPFSAAVLIDAIDRARAQKSH